MTKNTITMSIIGEVNECFAHRHTIIMPAIFECEQTVKHKNGQEFTSIVLQGKLFTGLVDLSEDGLKAEDKAAKAEAL